MLDVPSPGSFQNIGQQQGSEHVKPCGSNWVKIKRLVSSVVLLSRYIVNNELPVAACVKRLLDGKGFNGTQEFLN